MARISNARPVLTHDKPWQRAASKFLDDRYTFGDIIALEWLYEAFDIPSPKNSGYLMGEAYAKNQFLFLNEFKKFEKHLITTYNMHLRNVYGKGYEIVKPSEQTQWAQKDTEKELAKTLRTMTMRLTHIERSQLTDSEKNENLEALGRIAFFKRESRKLLE